MVVFRQIRLPKKLGDGGGWSFFANIRDWQSQSILKFVGRGCVGLVQLEHLGMVEDLAGEIPFPELHQFR